jgi:hypothetical protein
MLMEPGGLQYSRIGNRGSPITFDLRPRRYIYIYSSFSVCVPCPRAIFLFHLFGGCCEIIVVEDGPFYEFLCFLLIYVALNFS